MKEWNKPEIEELEINATANGQSASEDFDGDWVSINGKWYRPGSAEHSQN